MNHPKAALMRGLAIAVLALSVGHAAYAQRIPASASDSGRRAVVAVDQSNIYNSINNANNTANYAYSVANNAQNTANYAESRAADAQAKANEASGGLKVAGTFEIGSAAQGAWMARGLCLYNFGGSHNLSAYGLYNPCPGGSGPWVSTLVQGGAGGGEGGGGGGT